MKKIILIIALIVSGIFISCSEQITDKPLANKNPNTFLFLYPSDENQLSQQKSRLKVHWWGDDSDGLIIGYYFNWKGLNNVWTFTTKNDSLFSLPIGTADTTFVFQVVAVDNNGNRKYDNSVIWNDVDLGPEPFVDANNDGVYNSGEKYFDIGLIDPTPAQVKFPIKNTPPTIQWTKTSILPSVSFPVMTVAWEFDDLDGIETIVKINLALNDTTQYVSLNRSATLVTLRIDDVNSSTPQMQILINGSSSNIASEKLKNLKLDDYNRLYVQAEDISGAKSAFIPLPSVDSKWYIKKPKGKLLIIDDFAGTTGESFYQNTFSTINSGALAGNVDVLNLETEKIPYPNITLLETMKLFKTVYWYSDSSPNLDYLNVTTQKYLSNGGKIAFSMTFQDSTDAFPVDISALQGFLPVEKFGENKPLSFLLTNASLTGTGDFTSYPALKTSSTISFVRTYQPSSVALPVYNLISAQKTGVVSFIDSGRDLFFVGLPLHQCDGNSGNVGKLLEKIFFEEFGLVP